MGVPKLAAERHYLDAPDLLTSWKHEIMLLDMLTIGLSRRPKPNMACIRFDEFCPIRFARILPDPIRTKGSFWQMNNTHGFHSSYKNFSQYL